MAASSNIVSAVSGRRRVIITGVYPEIDGGRFAIKRVLGEEVVLEADIFADGHDVLSAVIRYRSANDSAWTERPMEPVGNDRWRSNFTVERLGPYFYTLEGWVDPWKTWRRDLEKKIQAGLKVPVELLTGAELLRGAAERATGDDAKRLRAWAKELARTDEESEPDRVRLALDSNFAQLAERYPDRHLATRYDKELEVTVDPVLARFGAWYEMFPRSFGSVPGRHGTFREFTLQLERVAAMGFDILYLPPIHPVGRSFRKGINNAPAAQPGDPGSVWAIGAAEGGHKAILPELGTLEDFRALVRAAKAHKLEIALDVAFQCAPDHPYVTEGKPWFRKRPDGSIQYAENPPKKYQDIYPFDFETEDWTALWAELKSVFEFWIEQGVTIFRVDNPHTKPFAFWEWVIAELKAAHPELIFLSEAFTRPKVLYRLAKLGFTQSYNYFPWRNTKAELADYLTELSHSEVREYCRPALWPNTPDILTQYLQYGGRPAFMVRLILAATLGATYGIYGPAFELCVNTPRELGSEEYLNSEKYEIKEWDLEAPGNLTGLITTINQIRHANPALHSNESLRFHGVENDQLILYSKKSADSANMILVVVNLDLRHVQSGWTNLALEEFGLGEHDKFQVHDLLTDERYLWQSRRNYLELDPARLPAHIFRLRRKAARSEEDFENFA